MEEKSAASHIGLILIGGVIVALGLIFFVTANGERSSAKKVRSDADMPKIASPAPREKTGSR
jgi:hypothetical protein